MAPLVRRTWAPRGQTPILLQRTRSRDKVSMIATLTVSPWRRYLGLYAALVVNANVNAERLVEFLRTLLRHRRGPMILIWDRLNVHRAGPVKVLERRHPRLHTELLPPYAPELNPVERVWSYLKLNPLANHAAAGAFDLARTALGHTRRVARCPSLEPTIGRRLQGGRPCRSEHPLCDGVAPGTITDLTPDVVTPNEIWFMWPATSDDGVLPASGIEKSFDLRARTSAIDNESAWAAAPFSSQDESVPGVYGTWGTGHIGGLQPCTWYQFAVRAMDDNAQLSGFHDPAPFQTFGSGCGGGFSAHEVRVETDGEVPSAAGGATAAGAATAALLVETRRAEGGAWRASLRPAKESDGLDPGAAGIAIEQSSDGGGREPLGRVMLTEDQGVLGICSLRERGRVVIPEGFRLEKVIHRLRGAGDDAPSRRTTRNHGCPDERVALIGCHKGQGVPGGFCTETARHRRGGPFRTHPLSTVSALDDGWARRSACGAPARSLPPAGLTPPGAAVRNTRLFGARRHARPSLGP